jgi:hypothetical protein
MVWSQLMLGMGKFPQILMPGPDGRQLDLRAIFNEVARNLGVKNIDQFYMDAQPAQPPINAQIMPDEQVQQGAQAGNMLPARLPGIPGMAA